MDSFRNVLLNRQPSLVWKHFYEISRIPHCSKHEEKLRKHIVDLAHANGLETKVDEAGNLTVTRPASPGLAESPGIVLQAHLDMVCEKDTDLDFDFSNQSIQLKIDGDWLMADGTTLGADNGIGVAIALAVLEDKDLELPQVEALFTVSEEIGLIGATNLAADMISGQILINLDTENVDTFYVGCAGGCNTILDLPLEMERPPAELTPVRIIVDGLAGGHSGVEIHQGRANALKLMGRLLDAAAAAVELRLVRLDGGKSLNVIPRQAEALALVPQTKLTALKELVAQLRAVFKTEVTRRDAGLDVRVIEASAFEAATVMTPALRDRIIGLLVALPYGPTQLDQSIPGLVQTSTNLAAAATEPHGVVISTKQRGSEDTEMMALSRSIETIGIMAGATVRKNGHYPGWKPDTASPLLQRAKTIFTRINGQPPGVASIHAGLECGLLGDKFPGLDMLSIGATIHNAHSPQEKLSLSSVDKLWTFLVALLQDLTLNP
jgi:dipeptidase D